MTRDSSQSHFCKISEFLMNKPSSFAQKEMRIFCFNDDQDWGKFSIWLSSRGAGVTVSDSDSAPVPKFWNPSPAIFQIWVFDSCSDSGYNQQSNLNWVMFYLRIHHTDSCYCRNWKVTPGPVFPKFLTSSPGSGSKGKTQNPARVDPGYPHPVPPLLSSFAMLHFKDQVSPTCVEADLRLCFHWGVSRGTIYWHLIVV